MRFTVCNDDDHIISDDNDLLIFHVSCISFMYLCFICYLLFVTFFIIIWYNHVRNETNDESANE